MRKFPVMAVLVVVMLPRLVAQDFYGDLAWSLGWRSANGDFIPPSPAGDLSGYLSADLYAEFRRDDEYSFLTAVRMEGPMGSGLDAYGASAASPLAFSVTQCYLVLPLDPWRLLVGKRYREIGWTRLFNVANLVTPRAFAAYDFRKDPPAQVELGLALGPAWLSASTWFTDAVDWEDVAWLVSGQVVSGPVAAEGGLYGRASGDWHAYASGSANLGTVSLYAETILDAEAVQERIVSATTDSVVYAAAPDGPAFAAVVGLALDLAGHEFRVEYLHRSQGYSDGEAAVFLDAARTVTNATELAALLSRYGRFAFRKDYAGVAYAWREFLHRDLALGFEAAASLPDLWSGNAAWAGSSLLATITLDWQLNQAFALSLKGGWMLGDDRGEFPAFTAERALATLGGRLSF